MVAFYRDVVGAEELTEGTYAWEPGWTVVDEIIGIERTAARVVTLKLANVFIELFQFSSPEPKPADPARRACDHAYAHIAFDVEDVPAEYERLLAGGMRFHAPPMRVAEGLPISVYGQDPDGNVIELQESPPLSSELRLEVAGSASGGDHGD
jgi:catechol 2,3-dioxygenase-like lactoylglutathione lyase family enzyme